ncbi:MAG: DUF3592 domain-containing protein [bacterium]|nr:DUF3592 domain-containing protein [bacterium]
MAQSRQAPPKTYFGKLAMVGVVTLVYWALAAFIMYPRWQVLFRGKTCDAQVTDVTLLSMEDNEGRPYPNIHFLYRIAFDGHIGSFESSERLPIRSYLTVTYDPRKPTIFFRGKTPWNFLFDPQGIVVIIGLTAGVCLLILLLVMIVRPGLFLRSCLLPR